MVVKFFFADTVVKLKDRNRLKLFLKHLFKMEKRPATSLTYVFCTDGYLLSINNEFLQHDTYTDTITFCLTGVDEPVVGEIYISIDRVLENASRLGIDSNNELHRVIFHGALHLCGFKDKKPADKKIMRRKEDEYLQRYFK